MPTDPPFPELLSAAKSGDHAALATIYRRYAPAVLGYMRGEGARDHEDLASEVFVGVVRGLDRFAGDEPAFRSWLFSIAHRRLLDERRRQARRVINLVDPAELPDLLPPGGDVEEEALAVLPGERLAGALAGLTPAQRAVLLLRVVADLPVAEVSRIVHRSEGAVKLLQRRALASLSKEISAQPVT